MTASDFATSTVFTPVPRRVPLFVRLLRNPMGAISIGVLTIVALIAIFGPILAPLPPNFSDVTNFLGEPTAQNLLGTDPVGRDVWSRLLSASQLTIAAALLCVVVSLLIGVPAGLLAGYYGGFFDRGAGWLSELLMSLPGMIVLLAVRAALGPSVWIAMAILGVVISPAYFRLTRAAVRNVRKELYVDAARVSGLSDARIIARHIVYVVRAPIIIQTAMIFGLAIAVQSGLQFLGLGDPLSVTWGTMLGDAFGEIYRAPLLILWPALAIGVTVGSSVLFANALRDVLDEGDAPQARRRTRPAARKASASDPMAAQEPAPQPVNGSASTSADALLSVDDLAIAFEQRDGSFKRVVDGVSLTVRQGEVVGLVGESGSGKTQTAFAILGLLAPQAQVVSGSIIIDGVATVAAGRIDTKHLASLRGRRISYIPQEPMSNLDRNYTIGAQLTRPIVKLLGVSRAEAKRRVIDLLERVGITDPEKTFSAYPHEISGGMAQRVLIAGAVSCEPDLIIADEPTTALDVTVQADVLDLLREMKDELGVGILLVTHNFGVVGDLADRVVVMRQGAVVEEGDTPTIIRHPKHPYTQVLIGSMIRGREPRTLLTKEEAGR